MSSSELENGSFLFLYLNFSRAYGGNDGWVLCIQIDFIKVNVISDTQIWQKDKCPLPTDLHDDNHRQFYFGSVYKILDKRPANEILLWCRLKEVSC